jgi:type IV secretion/conjugal transfer VirB4 family ATPase
MGDFTKALRKRFTLRDLGAVAREQHSGRPSAELAPWLFALTDDVIVNKDAGLMACLEFNGIDTDGAAKADLIGLAAAINRMLVYQRETGLMQWWTVQRRKTTDYPHSAFPDAISRRIDADREAAFLAGQNYVNRHYLSVGLPSPVGAARLKDRISFALQRGESFMAALINAGKTLFDEQRIFPYSLPELDEARARLEEIVSDTTGMLTDLRFSRLSGPALGGFLHGVISPQASFQEGVSLSGDAPFDDLLDDTLPEGEVFSCKDFLVFSGSEKKFTVAVTIKNFTRTQKLGGLDRLYSIPGELTVNFAFRLVPKAASEAHAERMRNFHESRKVSWKSIIKSMADKGDTTTAPVNRGHENKADQAADALADFTQDAIAGMYFYFCVLCHGDTLEEADATAERVRAVMRNAHLRPETEAMHLLSAFATTVPGGWKECARWKFFNSLAFAMIAPVHTISRGNPVCRYLTDQTKRDAPAIAVLPTDYATPYYFDLYQGDLGHGFLVGPSRAGKSVLANMLATMFRRYPDAQIIVFDKDYSSRIPILLQGGAYLDFANDDTGRFNPLRRLSPDNLEWTTQWIELLLAQRDYRLNADDSRDLEAALKNIMGLPVEMKRLSSLLSQLSRPQLRQQLEPWVGQRVQAKYFDNQEDGFDLSGGLVGIEVGKLLTNPQVAIPMMEYCFERIDSMLRDQREAGVVRPTFIYLAEVWHLIRHEYYRDKLNDWLKTLAKRAAVVWMDTQSIEDLASAEIFASLRDNIPNRIYLPNRNATSESLYRVYHKEFELTGNQIERIAAGTPKRDYLIQQGQVSRMVQLRFEPRTLACLRSDMAAQIVFDKHWQSGVPDWQERYIEEVLGV